jgi:hypothetical protein
VDEIRTAAHYLFRMKILFFLTIAVLGAAALPQSSPASPLGVENRWSLDAQRNTRLHRPYEIRRGVPPERRKPRAFKPPKPEVAKPSGLGAPRYGTPRPAIERIPRV